MDEVTGEMDGGQVVTTLNFRSVVPSPGLAISLAVSQEKKTFSTLSLFMLMYV